MQKINLINDNNPQESTSCESKIAIVLPNQSKFHETSTNNTLLSDEREKTPLDLQQQQHAAAIVQTQQICNQEALDLLQKRTGYPIIQENGQRKYGPPPNWQDEEPDRACEVFVGKIPRDCFEDELVPVLERVGLVYEFRLMMEYSGYNRGYGFVMFTSRDHAKKAVNELNNYEIRKNRMIGLCRSVDNCRLFVGGIPKNKKREEILEEMKKVTDDVVNVIVYPSANDKSKNRGFAFVQYTNHRAAAVARRKLIPARIHLFGQPIAVDWAEPEPEVDDDVMKTVKVLYVRNLMLTTSEELIKMEFEKIKLGSVERVKKLKDFAFVHFKEREDALSAMKIMNNSTIDGALIEVTLSKPVDKNNYMRFTRQTVSPTSQLLLDPNEINFLLGAQNLQGINIAASPYQTSSIPAFQHFQHSLNHLPMQNFVPSPSIQNLQHLQSPQILPQNHLLGNLIPDPNNLLNNNKPGSRVRMVPSSRGAGGVHRSAYYNTVKGVNNGGIKRQLSNEDTLHDFYAGVKPVPMLPINNIPGFQKQYPIKPPNQVLEEICLKESISPPIYTLHTTSGKDQEGREISLFLYKIVIPSLFGTNQLSSNRLMRTLDDAKNDAAEFILMQMFPQFLQQQPQSIDSNENFDRFLTQVYQQQQQQTQSIPNLNTVNNQVGQPQLGSTNSPNGQNNNTHHKNIISPSNEQVNLFVNSSVNMNNPNGMVIPGTSGNISSNEGYPVGMQQQSVIGGGAQYIIDPSGYLMYQASPGWQ